MCGHYPYCSCCGKLSRCHDDEPLQQEQQAVNRRQRRQRRQQQTQFHFNDDGLDKFVQATENLLSDLIELLAFVYISTKMFWGEIVMAVNLVPYLSAAIGTIVGYFYWCFVKIIIFPRNMVYAYRLFKELIGLEARKANDQPPSLRTTVEKRGYRFEEHEILTEDGCYLTLHRIPGPTEDNTPFSRPVVLLQHGLKCSSADFIVGAGLAFDFADAGYDVWLGNFRGNVFSRRHKTKCTTSSDFWRFSWEEHGLYDVPKMIEHVLSTTGKQSLRYVGHSMGNTALFVMLHTDPTKNRYLSQIDALAPVTGLPYVTGVPALFFPLALYVIRFYNYFFDRHDFMSPRWLPLYCTFAVPVLHFTGWNQIQTKKVGQILTYSPESTSTGTLLHYISCTMAGRFQSKDGNTVYDLRRVTRPVHVVWAPGDWACCRKDVDAIVAQLSGSPKIEVTTIESEGFGHLDFLWSLEARSFYSNLVNTVLSPLA